MNKQSGFSKTAIIAVIAVVILGGALVFVISQNKPESQKLEVMSTSDKMMENEPQKESMSNDAMMQKPGSYKTYSPATVEAEQAAGNKVVLFFHAPWCPFCKAADSAFNSRLSDLPSGVALLKTDYDSSTELKQKYGVTYQHTFVQIDSNENQVTKWNGGDIDNLKKYLK